MESIMTTISKTSLRTLLGAAALASLVSALVTPASAAMAPNGIEINGVEINGVELNGTQINGVELNGTQVNGVELNALAPNGVNVNGVILKGTSDAARQDGGFDFGSVTLIDVTAPAVR
jgi:uncharacterized protein YjbI with pentapeptide repeats